jgi:hypothetical protein
MYCPTCGAQLPQALSYCNHCGANLGTLKVQSESNTEGTAIDTLVWVIVGTTITLLGMALGALVLMKNGAIDERLGIAFVVLSFVALALVEGVLVWRLRRLNRVAQATQALAEPRDLSTAELGPARALAPGEPAEFVPSVTEQTTRTLEPSYRDEERR